ncbi:MAG: MotA/TolQ/ExbB proton channel family protein [Burkholderiales bacterium]|nr:MotA/TolQ/ExbB proton channel family protein [Burkholderiales bacterium]
MLSVLENFMFQVGQLFLIPVLLAVCILFLYSFWLLGGFIVQAWKRKGGGGRPLLEYARRNPGVDEDALDLHAHKLLELPRIVARIAPMLGLVATMIPMGPALLGLSDGNLGDVSKNLTIAFAAVILALIAASLAYWVVSVRRRWLAEEMLTARARQAGSTR